MYRICIIESNVAFLTKVTVALQGKYSVLPFPSALNAVELLNTPENKPDLILLSLDTRELQATENLIKITKIPFLHGIPIVVLTTSAGEEIELESLSLGAVDCIQKPISVKLLVKHIEIQIQLLEQKKSLAYFNSQLINLVDVKVSAIVELQFAIISTVADLIEQKDGYTGGHVMRVQKYMEILMTHLAKKYAWLTKDVIEIIAISSKLHDLGKIGVPDKILLKKNKLDADETEIIRLHTTSGAKSLEKSLLKLKENMFLNYAFDMAKFHHEKWDGSGYPDGLSGENIPYVARILAVCDVYDAITSIRSYKNAYSHEVATDIIKNESAAHFDPELVQVFLESEHEFKAARKQFDIDEINDDKKAEI